MTFKDFFLENKAKRKYACLMLDCSNLKPKIDEIQRQIDRADLYTAEKGHAIEKDIHITALYGFVTDDSKKVFDALPNKKIGYALKKLSLFENDKFDVLKIDVESKDLKKLNKKLDSSFKNENSYPNYIPHLTIAYLKPGMGKKYVEDDIFDIGSDAYEGDSFVFSTSQMKKFYYKIKNASQTAD